MAAGMLSTLDSCALFGIDAFPVQVEVDVTGGNLPSYHVVGLPATSIKEGGTRIRSALEQIGCAMPAKKVTVNLAPADRRKSGAAFDLPIAIGVLEADDLVEPRQLEGILCAGELGLDGRLRPIRGALSAAILARARGLRGVLVPAASAAEAAAVDDLIVYEAEHLGEVVAALRGELPLRRHVRGTAPAPSSGGPDMSEVRGQVMARAALEIAVAGGHNLLMMGPPGIGKTMLARRLPGILPPLTRDEALEATQIYSAVGMAPGGILRERPFRAPHHSISQAALIGGGAHPRPGEISLAHHGVLFLDEIPEFAGRALEALRQPLEDRAVTVGRVRGTVTMPASFLLVGAANPCPCGWSGSGERSCTCSPTRVERYRRRLSGPLLDRIDLQVMVENVSLLDLRGAGSGESSAAIRARVVEARDRQRTRLAPYGARTNAEMSVRALRATCRLDGRAEETLRRLHQRRRGMTARTVDRMIKVARTIADLRGLEVVDAGCIGEAAAYRALDNDPVSDVRLRRPARLPQRRSQPAANIIKQ